MTCCYIHSMKKGLLLREFLKPSFQINSLLFQRKKRKVCNMFDLFAISRATVTYSNSTNVFCTSLSLTEFLHSFSIDLSSLVLKLTSCRGLLIPIFPCACLQLAIPWSDWQVALRGIQRRIKGKITSAV